MLKTHRFLQITFILFVTQTSHLCQAMNDTEALRREVLKTNAYNRLYAKMNTIIKNEDQITTLTKDEQYLLLKKLSEEMKEEAQNPSTGSQHERFEVLQTFFDQLKTFVAPDLLQRALPSEDPSPELTPRSTPPPVPPRTPTPVPEAGPSQPRGYRELASLEEESVSPMNMQALEQALVLMYASRI